MSSNPPDDNAPFTWPPAPADLARIDVLDVARTASSPSSAESASAQPTREPRQSRGRRVGTRPKQAHRRAGGNPWLPLAAGLLIGLVLPGLLQVRTAALWPRAGAEAAPSRVEEPTQHADGSLERTALARGAVRNDGQALLAMQALLRGDMDSGRDSAALEPRLLAAAEPRRAPAATRPSPVDPHTADGASPAASVSPPVAGAHTPTSAVARGPVGAPRALAPNGSPSRGGVRTIPAPATRARTKAPTTRTPAPIAASDAADQQVRRVLRAYERAWTRMDVAATRAVWPSADAMRVQAAFGPVSEQRLELAACDVGLSGDRALAVCLGTRRFRPRTSSSVAQVERGRWEFALERAGAGWQIRTVDHP